jgi:DNA-binding response OmpR family regulator
VDQPAYPLHPQTRILVVEDEPTTRRITCDALKLAGYQVEEAASGDQALAKLSSSSYDLMLLDLRMPGVDGLEVLRRIQDRYPDLAVIILTAYGTLESAIAAVKAGASDYLLKPMSIRDVETAIARALQRRREHLRQRHLIGVIARAVDALQGTQDTERLPLQDAAEPTLTRGCVNLNLDTRVVVVTTEKGKEIHQAELTTSEATLLIYLMQHADTVQSCRGLARGALGYDVSEREAQQIVRPHISRLRARIEPDPSNPQIIQTILGKGYRFVTR